MNRATTVPRTGRGTEINQEQGRISPSLRGSMATVLFAWELGGGLGHMMQMAPLARALVRRAHRVYVALREVAEAESAFAGSDVCYLEAPHYRPGGRPPAFAVTRTFAHILGNVGWDEDRRLFALLCSWANLFALTKPDVVVFDHA